MRQVLLISRLKARFLPRSPFFSGSYRKSQSVPQSVEHHEQHPDRRAHRWGKEDGYGVVDGQKVPIRRTCLRSQENREQRLGSYELFQRSAPREHGVWDKMMRGLSTRNYGAVVKEFREACEVEKSAVSDSFIAASREKLQELMERPRGELRLRALLIDGTPFRDRQMIVALGIGADGCKTGLGLREGATENASAHHRPRGFESGVLGYRMSHLDTKNSPPSPCTKTPTEFGDGHSHGIKR